MDTRTLPDHRWDALVPGASPGASTEVGAMTPGVEAATTRAGRGAPAEVRSGFQVLSLEQYAASHARSMHEVREP